MKNILGILFLVCCSSNVMAVEIPTQDYLINLLDKKYDIEKQDLACKTLSSLSGVDMKARQDGLSIDSTYASVSTSKMPDEIKAKEREVISQIYNYPIFQNTNDKNKVIKKITYLSFLECREKGLNQKWNLM
ncbi:hypothetical protein ABW55_10325 [Acinetobacter sp. C15]|uniref:hypothetical protein n=1 Tax=Acinetobacter TaxID=469 RepID=UPI0006602554|nr:MULTISPECIES: hypothetical protein [Acinetobacter]KOR15148.1 hypothetical protein ABW55_10325 [Acinetobacter sp. C15]